MLFSYRCSLPALKRVGPILACTAVQSARAAPAVVYDPQMSVEQYNQKLMARDPAAYLLVEIDLPLEQIGAAGIVDRPVHFDWNGTSFQGNIQSAFFTNGPEGSRQVHVLARIKNRQLEGDWLLPTKARGQLKLRKFRSQAAVEY